MSEKILKTLKEIAETQTYKIIKFPEGNKVIVDLTTANYLLAVYNVLGEKGKAKFMKDLETKESFMKVVSWCYNTVTISKAS
jgi:hypothetical protein